MFSAADKENITESANATQLLLKSLDKLIMTTDPKLRLLAVNLILSAAAFEKKMIHVQEMAGKYGQSMAVVEQAVNTARGEYGRQNN